MVSFAIAPALLIAVILLYPFGIASSIATPVAASGPALFTVIVNDTTSPTFGVVLLIVLLRLRSACFGVGVTASWSFSVGTSLFGVLLGSTGLHQLPVLYSYSLLLLLVHLLLLYMSA